MGMAEYIDRKALREAFDNADADIVEEYEEGTCDWGFGRQNILEVINNIPAADVAPVRHGRWMYDSGSGKYFCSACDEYALSFKKDTLYGGDLYEVCLTDYCPSCGAKMDGDASQKMKI